MRLSLNILMVMLLLFAPIWRWAQGQTGIAIPSSFSSLEQSATTLNKPYFIFASVAGEKQADSLSMAAQQHPVVYSFIRIHYLSSFVGPVALKSSFANFRQLYRITETTLLVFDAAGRVVGRHANITNIGDLYRTLYEDYQLIAANPGPVGGQTNIVPGPRHITSPIPHPLEAEVATTAMPALAALPPHATYRGSGPAIGQYTIINANLPGLRAYKPETNETHPASVIMGLYPTQPRLVAALQALRTQTSLPCYTFMASNEYGTPFYILSVGAFSTPDEAWEQITTAIPSATPVCVGILIQP